MGTGWDYGYNIRIFPVEAAPGEAEGLVFTDEQTLIWSPPG